MRKAFLVFSPEKDGRGRHLTLVSDLVAATSIWRASSRLSPVWFALRGARKSGLPSLDGAKNTLLLGPVTPTAIIDEVKEFGDVGLTLGLYNVFLIARNPPAAARAAEWAEKRGVHYEWWKLEGGVRSNVVKRTSVTPPQVKWLSELREVAEGATGPVTGDALSEFVALMSSAVHRASVDWPDLLEDLRAWVSLVSADRDSGTRERDRRNSFQLLGTLTPLNAGLSRLTSQAFSGTSPVDQTECHWWMHSFLGTGVANMALRRLVSFLDSGLHSLRIPTRVQFLSGVSWSNGQLATLDRKTLATLGDVLDDDSVRRRLRPLGKAVDHKPLVPFFSGRDGFHATEITISAPLATITGCASARWTLKTLTHEVCHPVVQSVLDALGPEPRNSAQVIDADDPLYEEFADLISVTPRNALVAARQALLQTLVMVDQLAKPDRLRDNGVLISPQYVAEICRDWLPDIEEVLVHVLDFLYFYGARDREYVRSLWLSWTTVPGVGDRVHTYLLRTVCAVSCNYLGRSGNPFMAACDRVAAILADASLDTRNDVWLLRHAASELASNREKVAARAAARGPMIRVGRYFLYSPKLASKLLMDTRAAGRTRDRTKNPWQLDTQLYRNPLRYIESKMGLNRSAPEDALRMLYVLAFGVASEESTGD